MSTPTYTPIETKTLGSTTTTVSFLSIPQTYTDLVLIVQAKGTDSAFRNIFAKPNNDTASNYSRTALYGNGSSAGSGRVTSNTSGMYVGDASPSTGTFTNISRFQIMNYTNTTTYKTSLSRDDSASSAASATVSLWSKTPEAITSLYLTLNIGDFAAGSTFTLYGIKVDSPTAKATGGTIYYDAGYAYHVFTSSGTFTPTTSLSADILVVAGGGGTSGDSGGGGAGGLLTFASQSLSTTGYTVTVGAGGTKSTAYGNDDATDGGTSKFGALTTCVGGGRARFRNANGTGGSGAGGNSNNGGGNTSAGSGTSGQGNNGGAGSLCTGGGGGAGGIGGNANGSSNGGVGGIGATSTLINSMGSATSAGQLSSGNYYFAGGGAGWYGSPTPGLGGGGAESSDAPANMGGGGGGYRGNGGSGIVIVRYAR